MRTEESEKHEQETQDVGITLTTFEIHNKPFQFSSTWIVPMFLRWTQRYVDCMQLLSETSMVFYGPGAASLLVTLRLWWSMETNSLPVIFKDICILTCTCIIFLHDRGEGVTRTSNLWFPQTIAYGLVLMLESLLESCLCFRMHVFVHFLQQSCICCSDRHLPPMFVIIQASVSIVQNGNK